MLLQFLYVSCKQNNYVLVSEPTSFADAYSLVKASYLDEKLDNFGIVWNMSNNDFQAKNHFEKFSQYLLNF